MRRAILLGLTILAWAFFPLAASAAEPPPAAPPVQKAGDPAAAAIAYGAGKKAYDAGDYATARKQFILAIKHEPDNARWHYNLGLSLRQLGNSRAARQAFLKARELDPDYKKAEINKKLADLGFAADTRDDASASPVTMSPADSTATAEPAAPPAAASAASQDGPSADSSDSSSSTAFFWSFIIVSLAIMLLIGFVIIKLLLWLFRRIPRPATADANPDLIWQQLGRLDKIAAQLVRVEHAMRLGENPDLRNQLEYATRQEGEARRVLREASDKNAKALGKLAASVDSAATAAADADKLASELYGANAFSGQGDAAGCFFCARPLANPEVRHSVSMKRGDQLQEVLCCPECAAQAGRGEAPGVRTGADERSHWREQAGFDPYASRHGHLADGRRIPVWQLQPSRPLAEVARAASGGLLAGAGLLAAGAAGAVPLLLDLDAARQAALAREALKASAHQASSDRSTSFSDHS